MRVVGVNGVAKTFPNNRSTRYQKNCAYLRIHRQDEAGNAPMNSPTSLTGVDFQPATPADRAGRAATPAATTATAAGANAVP